MEIDVVIDVVCPWCFIGKRQLDAALKERGDRVGAVRYRPYQLNPDTPAAGVDRADYYARKFGDSPQYKAARDHMETLGPSLGIAFDFDRPARIANTLDAHRVIRWAFNTGRQADAADALMKAYFEDGRFLGDHDLLVSVAEGVGLDANIVRDLLAGDSDSDVIRGEIDNARTIGITGVPFFIFDGRHGVPGAQDAAKLIKVMDELSPAA
ncbi:DsbA family oxidoreductase [Eilatimonas milleporae]|uniref:Putative DsbA family dithiol-disulfide isomerase n=1 Tax=Eilatimonas milleporae TaxID=911205 RepID=A0A3M0CNQ1_9PROT|nr:DsbA family oxidoreductase [Eilatimonas milleporae]RMB04893.1 putative DsbA family dithiol-disulfide isomerase [Eilatimonas milleporae]